MASLQTPDPLPNLACSNPLSVWLDRIHTDKEIPDGFDGPGLHAAFKDLRFRLRELDMKELRHDSALGNSCRIICDTYAENLAKLRAFDTQGGGDPFPAKSAHLPSDVYYIQFKLKRIHSISCVLHILLALEYIVLLKLLLLHVVG